LEKQKELVDREKAIYRKADSNDHMSLSDVSISGFHIILALVSCSTAGHCIARTCPTRQEWAVF
jgi:hypothetical protein